MKLPVVHLPDIQANQPEIALTLTRVGVTDVKKLVEVARKDKRPIVLVSTFDILSISHPTGKEQISQGILRQ